MNYKEAVKTVQASKKTKENFMLINVSYDYKIILPHKEGVAFIAAMALAEQLENGYSQKHCIKAIDRDKMSVTFMSNEEYERFKIAALLGVPVSDLDAIEKEETK